MPIFISRLIFSLGVVVLFTSCSVWKYVPEDKQLLVSNQINIVDDNILDDNFKSELIKEIRSLDSVEQVNTKNLLQYRGKLRRYYKLQNRGKYEKLDKKLKTGRAEKPRYYDADKSTSTKEYITVFLKNKGYFHNEVSPYDTLSGQKAYRRYDIELNHLVHVGELVYEYPNDSVAILLKSYEHQSLVKEGMPLTAQATNEEYSRIQRVMRDNGYFNFSVQNIFSPQGYRMSDSTNSLIISILNDEKGNTLRRYTIGEVLVDRFYNPFEDHSDYRLDSYEDIQFIANTGFSSVKKKHITRSIHFRPGEVLNMSEVNRTKRRLQQFRFYQSPNFVFKESEKDSSMMDIAINLSPIQKIQLNSNVDFNFIIDDEASFFGFGLAGQYQDYNLFGGSEVFTAGVDGEFQYLLGELNPGQARQNFVTLGTSFNLSWPRFYNYLGLYNLTRKLRLGGANFFDLISQYGQTSVDLSYRYDIIDRELLSHTFILKGGYRLDWPNGRRRLSITHVDLSLFSPRRGPAFNQNNNPLRDRSFQPTLFTSLLIGDLTYNTISRTSRSGWTYRSNSLVDFSGLEVMAIDAIFGVGDTLAVFDNLSFARFVRMDQSHIVSKHIADHTEFVSRVNCGIAVPLWGNKDGIPFVKQFSLGGSNSMRAWQYRDVGIGGYFDQEADTSNIFYLTGDIKLELNLEYRFPLITLSNLPFELHGAIFTDIGNVWNIEDDIELREFNSNFLDQLAVGAGFGFRLDLSFFLLRLDLAYPIRNPYPGEDGSHYVGEDLFDAFSRSPTLQLGVGYPF